MRLLHKIIFVSCGLLLTGCGAALNPYHEDFNCQLRKTPTIAWTRRLPMKRPLEQSCYYGFYSNRARGERRKKDEQEDDLNTTATPEKFEVIDVSSYKPRRIPSKTWRDCTPRAFASRHIKKIWEVDPLECPKCHAEMKIISFISKSQPEVIRKILGHLGLWEEKIRPPPNPSPESPLEETTTDEPFDDGWPGYEEQFITVR